MVSSLDDSNFAGNIQSIVVWGQTYISLLLTIRPKKNKKKIIDTKKIRINQVTHIPDQRVNFAHFNVVQLLDSGFDLMLVSLQVGNKDQGVVVFNLFHSRFSGQWMFDDVVCI